jgi:hypothetical protein
MNTSPEEGGIINDRDATRNNLKYPLAKKRVETKRERS